MKRAAGWFDGMQLADHDGRRALVERAMADIGVEEITENSSPYIDATLAAAGTALRQPWCAAIVRRWCAEAGAAYPPRDAAAVAMWVAWAKAAGVWRDASYQPKPGDLVVYAHSHIGVVARVTARGARTVEGNTSFSGFSREGIAVDYKPMADGVAGFIEYRPASSARTTLPLAA